MTDPEQRSRSTPLLHAAAVLAAALILLWPALYNRYPLVYPDSVSYLGDGIQIVHAILHPHAAQPSYMRAPVYSLGILALHWRRTPWPVIVLQAILTAWILWLLVRSLIPRRATAAYLTLVAFLSVCTGLPWVVCWLQPDILGPILYLCLFLLVFARNAFSRLERILLSALVIWTSASHLTHLTLAVALCLLLLLLLLIPPITLRPPARPVGRVSMLIGIAIAAQLGFNLLLTGRASLTGNAPPFLMARLLADGPARQLVTERCPGLGWTLCTFAGRLPTDSDAFLWDPHGIYKTATPQQVEQLRREQLPLLLATLRAFPARQLRISLANFWAQLTQFDIEEFGNNPWAQSMLDSAIPHARTRYDRSLQTHDALNTDLFANIQRPAVDGAALIVLLALPLAWRRADRLLLGLTLIILAAVLGNAFLTGVLSEVDSRYQLRVIWLLPLAAALSVGRLLQRAQPPPVALP